MAVRGTLITLASLALVLAPACSPKSSTKLEIEIVGGFAFVPTPSQQMLEIAYLDDVDFADCSVDQIGTELVVVRGDITGAEPPAPDNRIFDLNGWVVNFPALDKSNLKFSGYRSQGMPSPMHPGSTGNWSNAKYVPALKDHHSGSKIKSDWRDSVNGRMVLKGGRIQGSVPSDPLMKDAAFDFQLAGTSIGKAAVTDKMVYTVDVPGEHVEMVFTNKSQQTKRLVLAPWAPGKPVRLLLRGLHTMPMTGAYGSNFELKDFCAFYSLLEGGEQIPSNKRLRLFYEAPQFASATPTPGAQSFGPNRPQPSPGFYCSGDWF